MPLKRTPPNTPTPTHDDSHLRLPATSSVVTLLKPSSSENDLYGSSASDAHCDDKNVSRRPKRKRTETSDPQMTQFMSEMRDMLTKIRQEQDNKLEKLVSSIEEIKVQNNDIKQNLEFLTEKYSLLVCEVNELKAENSEKNKYIKSLEDRIEKSERFARASCIEIKNIPVKNSETKTDLLNTVLSMSKILNVTIQPHDIKDIFRINTRNPEIKTIIVDLTSVLTKERILVSYKKFNKGNSKLSTEHLKLGGPVKPIYISENLTSQMKRLHYLTRVFASSNGYKFCWTTGGKIFIRKKDGAPHRLIKDETELNSLPKNL